MINYKTWALIFIVLLISGKSIAQFFMPELDNQSIGAAKEVYAINNNGDTIRGKIGMAVLSNGQLTSFRLKDESGVKHKFKASDVKKLAVKPSKLANMESAFSSSSIKEMLEMPVSKTLNREWVYFEQALLPKKKNKFALMQLLNSGFDSRIKVYLDPNANETSGVGLGGVKLTGGEDKSYLIVKGGKKAILIKKGKYKKEAQKILFDDCPLFTQHYKGDKFKFKNFEEHIVLFDLMCK